MRGLWRRKPSTTGGSSENTAEVVNGVLAHRIDHVTINYPVDPRQRVNSPPGWEFYALVEPQTLIHVSGLVADLAETIAGPSSPAITVSGAGGLGKTAVTHAAVSQVSAAGSFTHVVWASAKNTRFSATDVGEASLDSIYWHDVLRPIATQLNCPLPHNQALWEHELSRHVGNDLKDGRLLVVVDNLEVVHAADQVIHRLRTLGVRHPHQIVATTRWSVVGDDLDVRDFVVPPLTPAKTCDLVRLLAAGTHSDLATAADSELTSVYDITEGNPFLIKLITRRFVVTGRPLDRVIDELGGAADDRLGSRVRAWLFDRSLDELRTRSSLERALGLLFAFCATGRGGALTYEELRAETGIADADAFDSVLASACQLGLVRPSNRNQLYSIHSLLYQYTCPLAWEAQP
ncbi:NB-ARC domain-containing protein [Kutzneria sp. 744]|uniref:NB-ARC domain-containing protein n=1 Tax=Kutzneria sp. (strain 744) TaxID=345341 RepID=UPI0003EEA8BA|nr:NB-ARC domain-containing protein [Kutzneria sp. 744]EWM09887.1 PE-PGRS family protein [Kutzneria sp. 744]